MQTTSGSFTCEAVNIVEHRRSAAQRARQRQQDSRVGHGRIEAQVGLRPSSVHRRVELSAVARANAIVVRAMQQQHRRGRSGHEADGLGLLEAGPA